MLFALTLAVGVGALTLTGIDFEPALVLTIAGLTTTGQLAVLAIETPVRYVELSDAAKTIVALLMVLGRVEVLAFLALVVPGRGSR